MRLFKWLFPFMLFAFIGSAITYLNVIFTVETRWLFLFLLTLMMVFLKPTTRPPLRVTLIAFIYAIWCLTTTAWSEVPNLSFMKGIINIFIIFSLLSAGYGWVVKKGVRCAFDCLVLVAVVSLAAAILGFTSPDAYASGAVQMYQGLVLGPNMFGFLMVISALWILWRINIDWLKLGKRNLWLVILIMTVVFLWMSRSRSSILAFIFTLGGLIKAFPIRKQFLRLYFVILIAAVIFTVWPREIVESLKSVIHKEESAAAVGEEDLFKARREAWEESWEASKKGGWFGGGYGVSIGAGEWKGGWTAIGYTREKGNSLLAIIEEIGIMGLILCILLWVSLGKHLLSAFRMAKDPQDRVAIGLVIGFLTGILAQSQFEAWWVAPGSPEAVIFWSLAGVGLGLFQIFQQKLTIT